MRALHLAVLGASLLFGLGSSVIPVMNAEIYVGTVPHATGAPALLVALALGYGQAIGKIPLWFAGRGATRMRDWMERRRPRRASGSAPRRSVPWPRWTRAVGRALRRWNDAVVAWARADPRRLVVVHLVSSIVMIPPYAVWPAIAGAIGGRWWVFVVVTGAGRTLLFWTIALLAGLLPGVVA